MQRLEEVGRSFAAPARVNLIGEQTACAGGLVNVHGLRDQSRAWISASMFASLRDGFRA
jgi:Galactokinase galactose-binding signature